METPTDWVIVEVEEEETPDLPQYESTTSIPPHQSRSVVNTNSECGSDTPADDQRREASADVRASSAAESDISSIDSQVFDHGANGDNEDRGSNSDASYESSSGDCTSASSDHSDEEQIDSNDDNVDEQLESKTFYEITVLKRKDAVDSDDSDISYEGELRRVSGMSTAANGRVDESLKQEQNAGQNNNDADNDPKPISYDASAQNIDSEKNITKFTPVNEFNIVKLTKRARQREEVLLTMSDLQESGSCKSDGALSEQSKSQALNNDQGNLLKRSTVKASLSSSRHLPPLSTTDATGDTVEVHCEYRVSAHDTEALFASQTPSPECSTRFDFTPGVTRVDFTPAARRSTNDGVGTRNSGGPSSGYSGGNSVESGRKNPRAKPDSEVRSAVTPREFGKIAVYLNRALQWQRRDNKLNGGPGISNNTSFQTTRQTTQQLVLMENADDIKLNNRKPLPDIKTQRQCSARKPAIPHQLKSMACYQNGKVDVSILGDTRYLSDQGPVNVHITFVDRQPSPKLRPVPESAIKPKIKSHGGQKTQKAKGVNGVDLGKLDGKEASMSHGLKGVLPPIRHKTNQKPQHSHVSSQGNKAVQSDKTESGRVKSYDFRQIPAKKKAPFSRHSVLPPLQTKLINGKQMTIKKENPANNMKWALKRQTKPRRLKMKVRYSPQNFDIVNCRAQWPPFNTHINPEASERHKKLLTELFS